MYRLIKNLTPLVLIAFFFSIAIGTSWGGEKLKVNITMFNEQNSPITEPATNKIFIIKVQAFYNEIPLKEIKIKEGSTFETLDTYTEKGIENPNLITSVFKLKSPSTSGKHSILFEGINAKDNLIQFNHEAKVAEDINLIQAFSYTIGIVLVIGLIIGLAKGYPGMNN